MKQVQGSVLSSKWESLVNNLGHTCRKLGKFQESLEYHQQALVLQPMTHSTYAAIGYAHALLGDLIEAVEAFHRALSLKRDDTFSKSMLNYVIEQLMGDTAPFEGKNTKLLTRTAIWFIRIIFQNIPILQPPIILMKCSTQIHKQPFQ